MEARAFRRGAAAGERVPGAAGNAARAGGASRDLRALPASALRASRSGAPPRAGLVSPIRSPTTSWSRPTREHRVALGWPLTVRGSTRRRPMRDDETRRAERADQVALFLYGRIIDLLHPEQDEA